MARTADYTIQGFLYQFNKTLLEVLNSGDDEEITIEGIIEDIEVSAESGIKAVQCKYHETKSVFSLSLIYKPLLQMMQHFHNSAGVNIQYVLFAHFPNPPALSTLTVADLEEALSTTNKDLAPICKKLSGKVDQGKFLQQFKIEYGPSYDSLIEHVHNALLAAGIPKADIESVAYPNAIQAIAALSVKHDVSSRRITKSALLLQLRSIKDTAITRWTLALKTKKQIIEARRKQLKTHLDVNSRLRYLLIRRESLSDFDTGIVGFICDFLAKYHTKQSHVATPVFCLDCSEDVFRDVQLRLYKKGVVSNDGYIGCHFDQAHFFRQPITKTTKRPPTVQREFMVRLIRWASNGSILGQQKCDDLYIVGSDKYASLDRQDVFSEFLEVSTVKEFSYLTGVSLSYE